MQKGHTLHFPCQSCASDVHFSVLDLKKSIDCPSCGQTYQFQDETLQRQLKKFAALCQQVQESEEILSHTTVGVDVDGKQVRIPFKLLLTRFNSQIELNINGKPLQIAFRLEPSRDLPKGKS